jgi:hypothetical protein
VIAPYDCWTLASIIRGQAVNGELEHVSASWQPLAYHLATLPLDHRGVALSGFLAAREDRDEVIRALAEIDTNQPAPEREERRRAATLADIERDADSTPWIWNEWIPGAQISGIAAAEGAGKTRFAMDLARRLYFGLAWPDGQPATLPEGTPTLWICSDNQHEQLKDAAIEYRLPREAVILNTTPDDRYGGATIDDPEDLARLEEFIGEYKPGLVFIDSLTYATDRDQCDPRGVKTLTDPLKGIVQRTRATIVPLLHVSKEGTPLGRRIRGVTRTILQLEAPDPNQPERLRLWVSRSIAKRPPELGVTMGDRGNEYDFDPPTAPEAGRGGRPPESRDKAIAFISDALAVKNDQKATDLLAAWMESGGSESAFWRARDALRDSGVITVDGGRGTGKQMVFHLTSTAPENGDVE